MNKTKLRSFCMLPRWRIRVKESSDRRIYWEWCDSQGNSSEGRAVKNGSWRLFCDLFDSNKERNDWSAHEDDAAWDKLYEWAKDFGYSEQTDMEIASSDFEDWQSDQDDMGAVSLTDWIHILKNSNSEQERMQAIVMLEQYGTMEAYEALFSALDDPNEMVSVAAMLQIAELHLDSRAYKLLMQKLKDNDPAIRGFAAGAMRHVGIYSTDEERNLAIDALLNALKFDPDDGVRSGSAVALSEIGNEMIENELTNALANELNPEVRSEIVKARNDIRLRRAGLPNDNYSAFEEKSYHFGQSEESLSSLEPQQISRCARNDNQPVQLREMNLTQNLEKIFENEIIFFCGAGISKRAPSNLPNWEEMKTEILASIFALFPHLENSDIHVEKIARAITPETLLQVIHNHGGTHYLDCFKCFDHSPPNDNHYILASLAQKKVMTLILTKNFDRLLEKACYGISQPFEVYDNESSLSHLLPLESNGKTKIIKFHGNIETSDSLRVTTEQVASGYAAVTNKILSYLLERYLICFLVVRFQINIAMDYKQF